MDEAPDKQNIEFQICQLLDGQSTGRQGRRIEQLLEASPSAAEQARLYRALESGLARLDDNLPFDEFDFQQQREEVMAKLERRLLLDGHGPRSRTILLRPAWLTAAAAAAAVLVAAVGAALWLTRPQAPVSRPVAMVKVLPAQQAPLKPGGYVDVQTRQGPSWDEMPLAPEDPQGRGNLPSGTVVVSFGAEPATAAAGQAGVYPIGL